MKWFSVVACILMFFHGGVSRVMKIPYNCKFVDIIFVVDGSGSVGKSNFDSIKVWLNDSITSIMSSIGNEAQIGILPYSNVINYETTSYYKIPFRLGTCKTTECMTQRLAKLKFFGGQTNTLFALNRTMNVEFLRSPRANASEKVIVLITDGKATDSKNFLNWYHWSRRYNITTFAVGVGTGPEINQLREIANGNTSNERVFMVNEFEALPEIRSTIRDIVCSEPENAICQENEDDCVCKKGFQWSGTNCEDIDECSNARICTEGTRCINTIGGYSCDCKHGFIREGRICLECPCVSLVVFNDSASNCPIKTTSHCQFDKGIKQTCKVPGKDGFGLVFKSIETWREKESSVEIAEHVIEHVSNIDDAIFCASVATSRATRVAVNRSNIEASAIEIDLSKEASKMRGLPIFSKIQLENFSSKAYENDSLRVVALQYFPPKRSIDILPKEKNSETRETEHKSFIFTGLNPVLSFSPFNPRNFTYIRDTEISYTVDVSGDLSNQSDWRKLSYENNFERSFVSQVTYECMSINKETQSFSRYGCTTNYASTIGNSVSCHCNHTTTFAVLLVVTEVDIPRGVKIASYIVEILSIFFLTITVLILSNVRNHIRGDRLAVQISLSSCLLGLHILVMLGEIALDNEMTCEALTVLIHYLLLSTAMWMLMEGVTLLLKTNDHVLQYLTANNTHKLTIARNVLSWGIPFLIVLPTALIGLVTGTYMDKNPMFNEKIHRDNPVAINEEKKYNFCWLSHTMRIWTAALPVGVILAINLFIIIRMSFVVYKMSSKGDAYKPSNVTGSEKSNIQHVQTAFKAMLVLLPVLGIPWGLAFLTSVDQRHSSYLFMYINVVVNGLQGVFLFFVYCVLGKEVRKAVALKYKRIEKNRHSLSNTSKKSKTSAKGHHKTKETSLPNLPRPNFAMQYSVKNEKNLSTPN